MKTDDHNDTKDSSGQKPIRAANYETPSLEKENFWGETFKFVILSLLIVIPFRYFIAQPFIVSGSSMVPTFEDGQYLIVDQLSYRFEKPERGDVIIFKYPLDHSKYFIKRIVGLPGEELKLENTKVIVTTASREASFTLSEPYVQNTMRWNQTVNLKNNEYFVMGDNRPASSDSRFWGALPHDLIVGRPILRLLPLPHLGLLPGLEKVAK